MPVRYFFFESTDVTVQYTCNCVCTSTTIHPQVTLKKSVPVSHATKTFFVRHTVGKRAGKREDGTKLSICIFAWKTFCTNWLALRSTISLHSTPLSEVSNLPTLSNPTRTTRNARWGITGFLVHYVLKDVLSCCPHFTRQTNACQQKFAIRRRQGIIHALYLA